MALQTQHADFRRNSVFVNNDRWLEDFNDWPVDWPKPRDFFNRFSRNTDNWWNNWPTDWPRMDAIMPRFSQQLDRLNLDWRNDPFWADLYPRWAEPIFKEGIDVNSHVVNDESKFAVDVDCYQFRPEEIQVKTLDETLLIEGRHEEIRDKDNFTKMYFIRKYQIPKDVDFNSIQSSIDSNGRLSVEASKINNKGYLTSRQRRIPIEPVSRNTISNHQIDDNDSRQYQRRLNLPIHVQTDQDTTNRSNDSSGSGGVYSSNSYSYQKNHSRNYVSPREVTIQQKSPTLSSPLISERTATREQRSPGKQNFETIRNQFEKGANGNGSGENNYRHEGIVNNKTYSQSSSERRNGYRVESPITTNNTLRNGSGNHDSSHSPSTREYRSVQILRKTY